MDPQLRVLRVAPGQVLFEMALTRGQPTPAAYNAAIAAGDKATAAEPQLKSYC